MSVFSPVGAARGRAIASRRGTLPRWCFRLAWQALTEDIDAWRKTNIPCLAVTPEFDILTRKSNHLIPRELDLRCMTIGGPVSADIDYMALAYPHVVGVLRACVQAESAVLKLVALVAREQKLASEPSVLGGGDDDEVRFSDRRVTPHPLASACPTESGLVLHIILH